MNILGIDIGGTGIKGAIVDTSTGALVTNRYRLLTPQPSKPKAISQTVGEITKHFVWTGPIGCTFPAIIHHGVIFSAANVDQDWIHQNAIDLFQADTGTQVVVINDADAAGIAEMRFGAGRGQQGLVLMITLGTGIGSAMFYHGVLIPNAELGHLEIRGKDAEVRASDRARQEKDLTWKQFAKRLNEYLGRVEFLFSPDLFILGGGISTEHEKFMPRLTLRTRIVPAELFNEAGIVGAALAAEQLIARGVAEE